MGGGGGKLSPGGGGGKGIPLGPTKDSSSSGILVSVDFRDSTLFNIL